MRVKSYYASSVDAAMGQASAELGADAVLMHSRRTPAELRHLGPYEVVFALPRGNQEPGAAPERTAKPADPQVSLELMQMRRQIEEIRRSLATRAEVRSSPGASSLAERLWEYLYDAAVDEELAREIADAAALSSAGCGPVADDRQALGYLLRPELERRIKPEPIDASYAAAAPVVAFVGPPGCGKTACLVKMAVSLQNAYGSDIHLISADNFRVGAADQLRSYGAILGADVDIAENGPALRRLIELRRKKGPVFIDTPGLNCADFDLMSNLVAALAAARDVSKTLVLPATMRARDLRRMLREYEVFKPDRLLFTRLDETDLFGPIYSAAAWSGLPVSYLSAGQQIPDDLEKASPARIIGLVAGPVEIDTDLVN